MKYFLCLSFSFACLLATATAKNEQDDVTFIFYSRDNLDGVVIRYNEDSANLRPVFDPRLPTVLLIHGWQDNFKADSNTYVRKAVLTKTNVNVVKVDWGPLSNQGYLASRNAVPLVGRLTADLLRKISERYHYSLKQVTLVGFSLGAHIAGNVGKAIPGKIGVIVALDPAGPLISSSDIDFSVHRTDADYVQAIHTNGGTLGMTDAVGDVDFYPNGGSRQAGCGLDILGFCAHNRAWEFFAESVLNNRFVAASCGSWAAFNAGNCNGHSALMGGLHTIDKHARGTFYLSTNTGSPYGRG